MLRDHWYIGCASAQLQKDPYSAQIDGTAIVFFRDSNGIPRALKDRCCHRGLPLSKGVMKDGRLACGFHGWEYEGSGKCVRIPSQPDKPVPSSYTVDSYPVEERDGYVWIWFGGADKKPHPSLDAFSSGHWIQGFRVVQCNYLRALEITYDSMHIYFAHPTHPASVAAKKHGMSDSSFELRTTDKGCVLFAPPTASESDPIPQGMSMEFELPGRIRFEWVTPGAPPSYMYWSALPVTENSCRMDWLITNFSPSDKKLVWTEGGKEIIEEDQVILEAIQRTYEKEGESFERSVESDLPALTLRKIIHLAEKGAWPSERSSSQQRRHISITGPANWG